jgi:hypothetical protein
MQLTQLTHLRNLLDMIHYARKIMARYEIQNNTKMSKTFKIYLLVIKMKLILVLLVFIISFEWPKFLSLISFFSLSEHSQIK